MSLRLTHVPCCDDSQYIGFGLKPNFFNFVWRQNPDQNKEVSPGKSSTVDEIAIFMCDGKCMRVIINNLFNLPDFNPVLSNKLLLDPEETVISH